ncbi:MAG: DUF5615 family PIN-like protein [Anaerolineae bacterium]|nr:DUF5615 family PIN-like protein [Anaerolineae bacterium]
MEFKIDENLPIEVAELLRQAGYGATTVLEQNLGGRADSDVASVCQREGYALVTMDMDFADIRAYPPEQYPGIIVLRLKQQAEQWAREKVCWAVHVRSNVVRKDAHAFYETIGYRRIKTQFTFRKALHPHRNKDIPCNPEPAL